MVFLWSGVWAALAVAVTAAADRGFVPLRQKRTAADPGAKAPRQADADRGGVPLWWVIGACLLGAMCGATAAQHATSPSALFKSLAAFCGLTFIAVTDYRLMIIPNSASLALAGCRILAALGEIWQQGAKTLTAFASGAVWALIALVLLELLRRFSGNGIGLGDIKLLCALTFLCGPRTAFVTLLLGMLLCAAAAAVLLLSRKKRPRDTIPLGPALWIGYGLSILLTLA